MLRFVLRRLGSSVLLLFFVLTATFFLIHLAPGEPLRLFDNPRMSEDKRDELRQLYGLDRPVAEQYLDWLAAVLRGDWGYSLSFERPTFDILMERLPNTALLVLAAVTIEHVLGVLLGLLAAMRAGTFIDRQIRIVSLLLFSVPIFCLALLAIELLAVRWAIFPINQMRSDGADQWPPLAQLIDLLHHLALPSLVLGIARCGAVVRFVRNGLLEVLRQDYIRTAYAKGLTTGRVLCVHALRNSLIPLVQRFGVALPILLSGSLIVEVLFSWPGLGQTSVQAIQQRDYPMVLATTALSGCMVVVGNLLADLLQAWLDPRVRDAI
ncbi:MAG: ABC transporter permease [Acidobacteriota bacterium]